MEEAEGGQLCFLMGKVCLRVKKTQEDKAVCVGGGKQLQMTLSTHLDPAVPEASMDFSVTYSLSSLNQLEMGFYILKKKNPSYYISFLAPGELLYTSKKST